MKNAILWKKILRSAIFALFCLATIAVVNFFLPRIMPGDPVLSLIGVEEKDFSQEEYDYYYHELGLDKSMGMQFCEYVKGLFNGRLGYAYHYGKDVSVVIAEKIPRTLQIAFPAWLLSAMFAYLFGTTAGYRRAKFQDNILTSGMVLINTVPTFLIAMIMLILFAYELKVLPFGGLNSIIVPDDPLLAFLDRVKHLVLPVLTLVIASTPSKYIMLRNTTAHAMDEKYIVYAKARGLNSLSICGKHIFTNTAQPFIAMLGTSFGRMLSGSIVVEMIFSIDGMGMLVNNAINQRDFAILQGALFIIALSVIIANFIADIICIIIDPCQRLKEDL